MDNNFSEVKAALGYYGYGYPVYCRLCEDNCGELYITLTFDEDWTECECRMKDDGYSKKDIEREHHWFLDTEKYCEQYGYRHVSSIEEANKMMHEAILTNQCF